MRVEVLNTEEVQEQVMQGPGDVVNMLREMGGLHVATSSPSLSSAGRADSGNARTLYAVPLGWVAVVRRTGRRAWTDANSLRLTWDKSKSSKVLLRLFTAPVRWAAS